MAHRCPVIGYMLLSTDGFAVKHFYGVFDSEERIHGGDVNASAGYALCDELERRGWRKLAHSHDLERCGVELRIRHAPFTHADGVHVDDSLVDLPAVSEAVSRGTRLLEGLLRGAEAEDTT